jgi:hypothetical protein
LLDRLSTTIHCPVTEPVWLLPPDDPAIPNEPAYGYYFVNEDRSIYAGAWWSEHDEYSLHAGEKGNKVGWFKPENSPLVLSGQRMDAEAPPMSAHVPCCYPTRFQASGLIFPTEGCWEVRSTAGDSELSFVVFVEP